VLLQEQQHAIKICSWTWSEKFDLVSITAYFNQSTGFYLSCSLVPESGTLFSEKPHSMKP